MANSPGWRRAFDRAERTVGAPLTRATRSDEAAAVLIAAVRARRAVARRVDGVVSAGLHVIGLPSHRDIRALRRQVGALERELGGLRRDVEPGPTATEGERASDRRS